MRKDDFARPRAIIRRPRCQAGAPRILGFRGHTQHLFVSAADSDWQRKDATRGRTWTEYPCVREGCGRCRSGQRGATGAIRLTLNHQQPRHGRWPKAQTASPFRCNAVCIVTASVTGRRGNRSAKRGWPWGRAGRRDALVFPTWDGKPQSPTPVGLHVHALRHLEPHVRHDKAAEVMEALFAKVSAE